MLLRRSPQSSGDRTHIPVLVRLLHACVADIFRSTTTKAKVAEAHKNYSKHSWTWNSDLSMWEMRVTSFYIRVDRRGVTAQSIQHFGRVNSRKMVYDVDDTAQKFRVGSWGKLLTASRIIHKRQMRKFNGGWANILCRFLAVFFFSSHPKLKISRLNINNLHVCWLLWPMSG